MRCNWGNEKNLLTQCSDRKQNQLEESLTELGGHLDSRVASASFPSTSPPWVLYNTWAHGLLSTEHYQDVTPGTECNGHLMSMPLPLHLKMLFKENPPLLQEATNMPDIQSRPVKMIHHLAQSGLCWPLRDVIFCWFSFLSLHCSHRRALFRYLTSLKCLITQDFGS